MANYCKKLKTHTTTGTHAIMKTVAEISPKSAAIVEEPVKKRKK